MLNVQCLGLVNEIETLEMINDTCKAVTHVKILISLRMQKLKKTRNNSQFLLIKSYTAYELYI